MFTPYFIINYINFKDNIYLKIFQNYDYFIIENYDAGYLAIKVHFNDVTFWQLSADHDGCVDK
jgi:hypothetical protein